MKRLLLFSGLLVAGLVWPGGLSAQDPVTAAAEREQAEERYRTMNTRITQLEETLQSYQKRLSTLREENGKLRDEIERLKNKGESTATLDSLKHLAEKIEEVDKKRLSDGENVAKEFDKLKRLLLDRPNRISPKDPPTAGRPGPEAKPDTRTPGGREVGYEYAIREKDTLSAIGIALRRQGVKVTDQQIIDANPGVNWNKLKINQKIFIPSPP